MYLALAYEIGRRTAHADFEKRADLAESLPYVALGSLAGGVAGTSPVVYTAIKHRKTPLTMLAKMLEMTKKHPSISYLPLAGVLGGGALGYLGSRLAED